MFDKYSSYYDILNQEKDYISESKYLKKILEESGVLSGEILEFGSGTGKHGRILASSGYKVHGIELSKKMVKEAEITKNFTCQQGDISLVKINKTFNAVISVFHVMSYQTSNHKLISVFKNASNHLKKGGKFIFDFWYSPCVLNIKPSIKIRRYKNEQYLITRIAQPYSNYQENIVDITFDIEVKKISTKKVESFQEVHPMRHFSLPEIDLLGEISGFRRVRSEEFFTGKMPSNKTWGVLVVMEKI